MNKKITSVVVPVYFLNDSTRGVIGGLRAGWRSDKEMFVLSLLVGGARALTP
jgi:hypothetical protein